MHQRAAAFADLCDDGFRFLRAVSVMDGLGAGLGDANALVPRCRAVSVTSRFPEVWP
jgi:hypothetical protein